jgi:hypothetical protein
MVFWRHREIQQLLAPLLLGWFVNVLVLIPVLGNLASAIAWTAVLMLVFEEVDGIERLQAFGISAGINICFYLLQFMFLPGGTPLGPGASACFRDDEQSVNFGAENGGDHRLLRKRVSWTSPLGVNRGTCECYCICSRYFPSQRGSSLRGPRSE